MGHEDMLKGVHEKMKTRPARFSKRMIIPLVAACFLLITTVVAAQVINFGNGREWLTAVIGEDGAAELQFIGLSNIDVYDAHRVGSTITDDGVLVELIAVGVNNDEMDVYLLLQDTTGARGWGELVWNDIPAVHHYVRFTDPALHANWLRNRGYPTEFSAIDRDDDAGLVLLHSRIRRPRLTYGTDVGNANMQDLTLNIVEILYNFYSVTEQIINMDLGEFLTEPPTHFAPTDWAWWQFGYTDEFGVRGVRVLEPGYVNIEVGVPPMHISGIGVIEDRLHIQAYIGGYGVVMPFLVDPNGTRVDHWFAFAYSWDESEFIVSQESWDEYGNMLSMPRIPQFVESVFTIAPERLHEYQLFVDVFTFDHIGIDWTVRFDLQDGACFTAN